MGVGKKVDQVDQELTKLTKLTKLTNLLKHGCGHNQDIDTKMQLWNTNSQDGNNFVKKQTESIFEKNNWKEFPTFIIRLYKISGDPILIRYNSVDLNKENDQLGEI